MGRKIPFDQAMKLAGLQISAAMIFDVPNKYGYRVNINHPKIRPLYEAYHKHIGVPPNIHLTTPQRLRFETIIFRMMQRDAASIRAADCVRSDHSKGSR